MTERAPQIEDLSIVPQRVVYALLDASAIDGDSVHITVNLTASVQVLESPVSQVLYAILPPDTTGQPIRSGELSPVGNSIYTDRIAITLSALEVQDYPVLVYAVDTNNRLGGEARVSLKYVRAFEPGSPPVIEQLSIPATFQRPSVGEPPRTLLFVAEVSDPDGRSNIEQVEFWNLALPAIRYLLCDDGNRYPCGSSTQSGDEKAGDGLFTRQVFITSSNEPGLNVFVFEAIDRAGLRSQQVRHTLEILE